MAEKDKTEKSLEEMNDVFADIVNVLLADGKVLIEESQLVEANPHSNYSSAGKILEQERDVYKYWNKNKIRIANIGFENETSDDGDMPLRVLNYDGASYRAQFSPPNTNPRYPVVSLVLYFGYKHRWQKSRTVHECLNIPKQLENYISDYKMNLFEIAYLSDEKIAMFKSDFKYVADYVSQMRKTGKYVPATGKIKHVYELLSLMTALTEDRRFIDSYECIKKKETANMCTVLDECENRGTEKLLIKLIARKMAKGKSVYEIVDDLDEEIDVVREIYDIAKDYAPDYDVNTIYNALCDSRVEA
jgi:hypothetical protein